MKILVTAICICVSSFLLMGCSAVMGNLPNISAGLTGCAPETVSIHDESVGFYNDTWIAKCEGRTFYCTRQVRGNTTCTEAIAPNR